MSPMTVFHSSLDAGTFMSWHEFALLVSEAFRLQGYTAIEGGGAQPDGDVDLAIPYLLPKRNVKQALNCPPLNALRAAM